MKNKRQERILELIKEKSVETQEELSELLRREGYNVTQATVSRDIRQLHLVKTAKNGRLTYSLSKNTPGKEASKFDNILAAAVVSADSAGNITVVKTLAGMAQGAAAAIDGNHYGDIVGCVAGDDTILVVMRDEDAAKELKKTISAALGI